MTIAGLGSVGSDGVADDAPLRGQPVDAGVEAPLFDDQKGPQRQPDVASLGNRLAALAAFHVRHLLPAAVILFDPPTGVGEPQPVEFVHFEVTRPQCAVVPSLATMRNT